MPVSGSVYACMILRDEHAGVCTPSLTAAPSTGPRTVSPETPKLLQSRTRLRVRLVISPEIRVRHTMDPLAHTGCQQPAAGVLIESVKSVQRPCACIGASLSVHDVT